MGAPLDTIRGCIAADIPVLLWGAPGTGKTAAIQGLARERGAHLETLIGSTLDPTDVGGLPVPDAGGQVRQSPPPWARRLRAVLDAGKAAWIFLDELSCAPPSVQAALLRVVHERRVADLELDGCRAIAAANPADQAADGGWLSPAMASRWCHLEWVASLEAWIAGELSGWGRGAAPASAASVASFLRKAPASFLASREELAQADLRGSPCPRSWSAAIRLLAVDAKADIAGLVGATHAAAYVGWRAAQDLPDPEDVLAGRAKLPRRGDQIAVALDAVVVAALADRPDRDARVERAWHVLASVRADIAVSAGRALLAGAPGQIPDEAMELGRKLLDVL